MDQTNIENIAVISIHPKYGHAILNGEKLVEFRKTKFSKPVEYCIMYSTSPEKKIIGYFKIKKIVEAKPNELWKKYSNVGCINNDEFQDYYKKKRKGIAIVIENAWELDETYNIQNFRDSFRAPQSFMYLKEEFYERFKYTFLRQLSLYSNSFK